MCRYYFGDGRCANSSITEDICVGEQSCDFFSKIIDPKEGECDTESWYGLYCAKYRRFFCPGKSSCDTYEEYVRSLEAHLRSGHSSLRESAQESNCDVSS